MFRPTITAHSGCEGTPDGSLAAIRRGIELGADLVEVDVRRIPSLGLALAHDTVAYAADLVTLREAFMVLANHPSVGINCDLKEYGLAQDVLALASDCQLAEGQLAFSGSLRPSDLHKDPPVLQKAHVYLNVEEVLAELYKQSAPADQVLTNFTPWTIVMDHMSTEIDRWIAPLIEAYHALPNLRALNMPPRPPLQPYMDQLGSAGLHLSVWTINDEPTMRQLMRLPYVVNLTTRQVALAIHARE